MIAMSPTTRATAVRVLIFEARPKVYGDTLAKFRNPETDLPQPAAYSYLHLRHAVSDLRVSKGRRGDGMIRHLAASPFSVNPTTNLTVEYLTARMPARIVIPHDDLGAVGAWH
jgi:hypothetical protein